MQMLSSFKKINDIFLSLKFKGYELDCLNEPERKVHHDQTWLIGNADWPIEVTEGGIVILAKSVHRLKAYCSIFITEDGITTFCKEVQLSNEAFPILITISVSDKQL